MIRGSLFLLKLFSLIGLVQKLERLFIYIKMSKPSILSLLVTKPDQFKSLSPPKHTHTHTNINNNGVCSLSVTVTNTSDNQVIKRKGFAFVHLLGGSKSVFAAHCFGVWSDRVHPSGSG